MWGTYDLGKPRTRILRAAIYASGARVTEVHSSIWDGVEDKSVLTRWGRIAGALCWIVAYPKLLWRLARAPSPDVIVIGYLGQLDVLLAWPIAMLKRVPVVWDAFLSLHDTVVSDRRMISKSNPLAVLLWVWEWLACRAATRVVLDTEAQADLFRKSYRLDKLRVTSAFVGAETSAFPIARPRPRKGRATVLFYGQFIPLHGISTIVAAARLSGDKPIDWSVIGDGQMADRIRQDVGADPPASFTWETWVPYSKLTGRIAEADICLGVFGASEKAGRVIPNKVFQILSAGRPLISRDGLGIRELVPDGAPGIALVPPADPPALLAAVEALLAEAPFPADLHADLRARFSLGALSRRWDMILREAVTR